MTRFKFQVAQRVQLNEDYGTRKQGEQGVVVYVHSGGTTRRELVGVKMDTPTQSGSRSIECYAYRLIPEQKPFDMSVFAPSPAQSKFTSQPASNPDAISMVSLASDRIFPRRSYDTILKSLMEEMGELSTEIAIAQGTKKRQASVDGVKGEAVDVFVVAVDMLRAAWGDKLHTREFTDAVAAKLAKWEGK